MYTAAATAPDTGGEIRPRRTVDGGIRAARRAKRPRSGRVAVTVSVAVLLGACGFGRTGPAIDVGTDSATLTGAADNTEPGEITWWFEYGTTTAYGSTTPPVTVAITTAIPVESVVDGLDPGTTYHYRLCVDDSEGVGSCGDDAVFTTADIVVNDPDDAPDSQPGDGTCQSEGAVAGQCSLRAAVQEANANGGDDVVVVQPGLGTIELMEGELLVSSAIDLRGNGVTIDAAGRSRVLAVSGSLALEHTTLTGGRAETGAGLFVDSGATADVIESTITGNESTALYECSEYFSGVSPGMPIWCEGTGAGAGIFSLGTLSLTRSTVSGNHAIGGDCTRTPETGTPYVETCTWSQGAGVHATDGTVTDSTISGNWSDRGTGVGLSAAEGTVAVSRSTIVGNFFGSSFPDSSGVSRASQIGVCCSARDEWLPVDGTIIVQGSIVAGNAPACGDDPGVVSQGHNLVSDSGCSAFAEPGDQLGVAPVLGPLTDNGGSTATHLPFASSPAVDAMPVGTTGLCDATAPNDQRGVARPDGPACDVGAVEGDSGTTPIPLELEVNHGGDDTDALAGDGICQDAGGPAGACSLRAAVLEANARPGPDSILIVTGVDVTLTRTSTDWYPDAGDIDVADDLTIEGNGATIDAAGLGGVFDVAAADFTLIDVTLTGGIDSGLRYVAAGYALRLTDVTVRDNTAVQGGGIYLGGGSAVVERSTISDNIATNEGGGIYVRTAGLDLFDSTVSANATTTTVGTYSKGGGLYSVYGTIDVVRSTLVGNTTPVWPSLYFSGTIAGSVLDNPGSSCASGLIQSLGYNLSPGTCAHLDEPTDQVGPDPLLGPLAANGGPTWTHLPAVGSPLIDAVPAGTAGLCEGDATDQRGVARPQGLACDIGAVEL